VTKTRKGPAGTFLDDSELTLHFPVLYKKVSGVQASKVPIMKYEYWAKDITLNWSEINFPQNL
jgi:hypothetical protein